MDTLNQLNDLVRQYFGVGLVALLVGAGRAF